VMASAGRNLGHKSSFPVGGSIRRASAGEAVALTNAEFELLKQAQPRGACP